MRLIHSVACALAGIAHAYPGMGGLMQAITERSTAPAVPMPLPGDLSKGATTDVGGKIRDCLQGKPVCENTAKKASSTCFWV
jgi:hypothetical protein